MQMRMKKDDHQSDQDDYLLETSSKHRSRQHTQPILNEEAHVNDQGNQDMLVGQVEVRPTDDTLLEIYHTKEGIFSEA